MGVGFSTLLYNQGQEDYGYLGSGSSKVRKTVMRKDELCISVLDLEVRRNVSNLLGR